MSNWKKVKSLREPFNDAINYKSRSEKEFFSKIFLKTDELERCLSPYTYYLMGEKGSGKTAYAIYLENNSFGNSHSQLTTMTETQYKRFIQLKRKGKLEYSDYANIWRSILLLVVSQMIVKRSKRLIDSVTRKFSKIEAAIEKWNKDALNPEIESAFEMLSAEELWAKLSPKDVGEAGGRVNESIRENQVVIKHHLLEVESELKSALEDLKLSRHHNLFIDGIDFKPEGIGYHDYINCIKGLSEAAWQLNTEFFNSIRDSKGRIKIVLLIRPDIFHQLNLYNSNSRLQDNCVFLDWHTTESEYKSSMLFEASGKYFSNQQEFKTNSEQAWNHYFLDKSEGDRVFKKLLKTTFQKPRDILTFIKILRKESREDDLNFSPGLFNDPKISRSYSDYLLGEVRNYSSFYMTPTDFGIYIKFFQYLDGKPTFTSKEFSDAFLRFKNWANGELLTKKDYIKDSESLLQFFYDVNIIGYKEESLDRNDDFFHWAHRERTINNISPKVKDATQLILNPGIAKALDIGKKFRESKPNQKKRNGRRRYQGSRKRAAAEKT